LGGSGLFQINILRGSPRPLFFAAAFTYDQTGHGDGIGRLTSLTDQVGSLSRTYDPRGNIIIDARTITSQLYSNAYTYESAGRLSGITYASSAWIVAYTRDSAGQITAVTTTQPGHGATSLATSVTHMPFGPLASLTWGNGVTDARTFDLDYRMTSVKDAGTSNIQYLSYGYDADNNVHTVTDNVTPANDQTLTWDVIDRLTGATGSYTTESVVYDSASNRKTYTGTTITRYANTNRMKKWGSDAVAYDSAGNMTGFGSYAFTYSKADRMATADPFGTTSTYGYDAFGNRLRVKTGTNPFSVQMYDLWGHLLTETSAAATPIETDYVYLDDTPLSVIKPSTAVVSAIHTGRIGTPQDATSSTKAVVWTCNYAPFGSCSPTASVTQNLRLPGMYDDFTVMDHNGFRDFLIGGASVYLESDPLGLRAGIFRNGYNYANQNPFKYRDRLGLQEDTEDDPALDDFADMYKPHPIQPIINKDAAEQFSNANDLIDAWNQAVDQRKRELQLYARFFGAAQQNSCTVAPGASPVTQTTPNPIPTSGTIGPIPEPEGF
jgi:RHS repeat-associated protein